MPFAMVGPSHQGLRGTFIPQADCHLSPPCPVKGLPRQAGAIIVQGGGGVWGCCQSYHQLLPCVLPCASVTAPGICRGTEAGLLGWGRGSGEEMGSACGLGGTWTFEWKHWPLVPLKAFLETS